MKGCKFCPAHDNCSVTYRGSSCAAIRYHHGLEGDPEIVTNGDKLRAMSDEKLAALLANWSCFRKTCAAYDFCEISGIIGCEENMLAWLQKPAEEKK